MKAKQYLQVIKPYLEQRRFIKQKKAHVPKLKDTIISLASFPARYKTLTPVIASLLNQDSPAHSLHLWIPEGTKSQLPDSLSPLLDRGLYIHKCDHLGSYSKLIHALREFPDFNIVTADDDMIYPHQWLSSLHKEHLLHPQDISAFTCRLMKLSGDPILSAPYKDWKHVKSGANTTHPHYMSIGFTGVLYPPHTFNEEVFNTDLIQKLRIKNDDIWFKIMAVRNHKNHRKIKPSFGKEIYLPFTQGVGLKQTNVKKFGNEEQIKSLVEHYNLQEYFLQ